MPMAAPYNSAISDRPSDVITYDASGNRVAEVDYGYDETPIAAASATNHDDQNFGTSFVGGRGNATTETHRCFPLPPATQPCSDAITTYTYDETGQAISRKDPNGNLRQFSFADSFFDPAPPANATVPPGNTNAYLTQITDPTVNGVSHIQHFSYAYSDGALTISQDENTQKTTFTYADPLRRLTETDFPDTGQTKIAYDDAGTNPSVVTTQKITGSMNRIST
jgi:YD repeat-containing protein